MPPLSETDFSILSTLKRTVFDRGLTQTKTSQRKVGARNSGATAGNAPALAYNHNIALLDAERGAHMRAERRVALLETAVLLHEAQVVTADDNGAVHLRGHDNTLEDAATDGHVAGERALLVDVVALTKQRRQHGYFGAV